MRLNRLIRKALILTIIATAIALLQQLKLFTIANMSNMEIPEFSFGIFADVQYGDFDNKQNFEKTAWRFYRRAIDKLEAAITKWNQSPHPINFMLNLGDLVDGLNNMSNSSHQALAKVEGVMKKFKGPGGMHHTWGNHEFYNFNREELERTFLFSSTRNTPYYHFSPHGKLRIVVLDAYDVSLLGAIHGSTEYQHALSILRTYNQNENPDSPNGLQGLERRYSRINGALGVSQMKWLNEVLAEAEAAGEWVIVTSHIPIYEPSSYSFCMLWNYEEVLQLLYKHTCVKVYLAGHDHDGGHAVDDHGIHHVTLRGVVEALEQEDPAVTAHIYKDKLVLHNAGPRSSPIEKITIDI